MMGGLRKSFAEVRLLIDALPWLLVFRRSDRHLRDLRERPGGPCERCGYPLAAGVSPCPRCGGPVRPIRGTSPPRLTQ